MKEFVVRDMRRARSSQSRERGSLELVALGFCAALIVLLAIPLIEAILEPSEDARPSPSVRNEQAEVLPEAEKQQHVSSSHTP